MNIVEILSDHARNRPDHPAIEDGERIVTYGELDGLVDDAAANLQAAGIKPGAIVAIALEDSADHLIILCAMARAGAVIFSQNPFASEAELKKSLATAPVSAVIGSGSSFSNSEMLWLRAQDVCLPTSRPFVQSGIGGSDPLVLIQSSGTSGEPKSFLRSHAEVAVWARRHTYNQGWSPEERCLSLVRLSFNMGLHNALGMLQLGATNVINRPRSYDELALLVNDRNVSYLYLTPSHLVPLLEYAGDKALLFPNLRMMVVASAPTTHAQRLLARERVCANTCEAMGTNEAGLLTFASPMDQDAHPEAVGRIVVGVEGVEAQIVDDDDQPLAAGEIGQVRYKSTGYPTHYIDDSEATARAFRDGWFYPGDLAALNDEGYLFFKGRADDIINNAGAKFYPVEVENVLMAHPQVSAAAAFGWPHAKLGQVAVACVAVTADVTAEELQAFCKQKIAGYKVPAIIEVMPELPRNAMGKILKTELKDVIERGITERKAKC
ncbi:MAG: acyl--CoA ligase [Alphaproteobacteria bacterium]|nr:acyl--CoA ligase [Alphaproteobacteria bacterium]